MMIDDIDLEAIFQTRLMYLPVFERGCFYNFDKRLR